MDSILVNSVEECFDLILEMVPGNRLRFKIKIPFSTHEAHALLNDFRVAEQREGQVLFQKIERGIFEITCYVPMITVYEIAKN